MRLKVYAADTSVLYDQTLFENLYGRVSEYRRRKTDKMRLKNDRCLSIGVEFLLMCACSDFGIDYGKMDMAENEFAKPEFKNGRLHFNLSHSGERAMCIMSDMPVGCDVEKIGPANMNIAKRFFSQDENESVKNNDDFYRIWTQKESYIKCTGLGMHTPMDEFSVLAVSKGAEYSLFAPDAIDGYRYAWCVRNLKGRCDCCDTIEWKHIGFFG